MVFGASLLQIWRACVPPLTAAPAAPAGCASLACSTGVTGKAYKALYSYSLTLYVEDCLISQSNHHSRILKADAFLKGGRVLMFFCDTLLQFGVSVLLYYLLHPLHLLYLLNVRVCCALALL